MTAHTLTLALPPTDNNLYRPFCRRCKRSTGITRHATAEAKAWKDRAELVVVAQAPPAPLARPVECWVTIYAPNLWGFDVHGRIKLVMDALNGVLWHDDRDVAIVHIRKVRDRANPRVEVRAMSRQTELSIPDAVSMDLEF